NSLASQRQLVMVILGSVMSAARIARASVRNSFAHSFRTRIRSGLASPCTALVHPLIRKRVPHDYLLVSPLVDADGRQAPDSVGIPPLTAVKTTGAPDGPNSGTFNPAAADDEFAMEASGVIFIPAPGAWTFIVKSDDGFRLTIGTNHAVVGEFNGVRSAAYGDN